MLCGQGLPFFLAPRFFLNFKERKRIRFRGYGETQCMRPFHRERQIPQEGHGFRFSRALKLDARRATRVGATVHGEAIRSLRSLGYHQLISCDPRG